ncbi:MAG: hypothetical protein ABFQ65_00440 [Nanoarchaeota archaeon]
MTEVVVKVDVPSELNEEFKLALDKVVKQFVMNLKLSLIDGISEIPEDDFREVKESIVKEIVESTIQTFKKLKSGEIKPMTLNKFNDWCDSI